MWTFHKELYHDTRRAIRNLHHDRTCRVNILVVLVVFRLHWPSRTIQQGGKSTAWALRVDLLIEPAARRPKHASVDSKLEIVRWLSSSLRMILR